MQVLIIGNGFDIAHGLPTQYKQFLDFGCLKGFFYDLFFGERNHVRGKLDNCIRNNGWIRLIYWKISDDVPSQFSH